ncbi:MAG: hypothetical protein HC816_09430 [Leptolyngbyaceae cyanobacterium RM1_1_2]|nr:hypothetical protein [Leptolyngbyaceae cyanobacterium RM1_1_2]
MSSLKTLSLIALSLVSIGWLQFKRFQTLTQAQENTSQAQLAGEDQAQVLQLELMQKLPGFGFDNLIADWTFLQFLQYFGDDAVREQVGYTVSPDFFKVIVDKDPRFIEPYFYLSNSVSLYAAEPETSVALMAQGLESLAPTVPPNSYFVWRYKGTDELLFLGDGRAAQESFEAAAEWAEQSPDPEGKSVAESSRNTANFLAKNPSSRAAQISAWASILVRAVDDRTRDIAVKNIEALGGSITVNQQGQVSVTFSPDE